MRIFLLIFLVFVLPAAVFWVGTGAAHPFDAAERFWYQAGQLVGSAREEPKDDPILEEPEPPTDEEKREPAGESPVEKPEPEPKAKPDPAALFREGKFAEAARFATQTRQRTLAELGAAFAAAFPPPPEPYVVVALTSGSEHEGFALEALGEVRLMQPTGRAIGLPESMIASKRELTPAQMVERALPDIEKEATSGDTRRLLRATAAAFRIGRPDAAAPLIGRIVGADAQSVLQAISKDVPADVRDALFRAYRDAALAQRTDAPAAVTARANAKAAPEETDEPERTNPLQRKPDQPGGPGGSRSKRLAIQSEAAKKLMTQARPLREAGEALYQKVYAAGLDKAKPDDVEEAIRKYKSALDLYEKAIEIEDNDTIYALLTGCSKKLFQLRFWKEQVGSR